MSHLLLTCKNHPHLRWSCKPEAWSNGYTGARNIFFHGQRDPYAKSEEWPWATIVEHRDADGKVTAYTSVGECSCHSRELILAPENTLQPYTAEQMARVW